MTIEAKLAQLGIELPPAPKVPPGVRIPFSFVRVHGDRAYIAGHTAQRVDGSLAGPFGKVGEDVSPDAAYDAARLTAVSMLGSLKRELGDLDRVDRWLRIFGMVNTAPDFNEFPAVINGCSDLILELWGEDAGQHARSAIGVAGLPWNFCVEIEAEVAIRS
ncbi:MAG: RidA family protein [Thermomicrobiales bacterium]|jgi:enamine deaminase RidA (YjgF/YER057c/UK114 family)|nr:RidA family protein [Thermomicrobiales bacterium]